MTARDELRAMSGYPHTLRPELHKALEDAGIDYWVAQGLTFWNCEDGRECVAYGYQTDDGPKLAVKVVGFTSPAQAIAATLGDNDATQTRQDDAIDDALIQIADWYHDHLSEYAEECEIDEYGGLYWVIGRDVSDDLDNLIIKAQNLAATLGADEYAIEHNVDGSYKCPICGCVVDYDVRGDDERIITMDDYVIPFNFCPKCGAEVVDE